MNRLLALTILLTVIGCAGEQTSPPVVGTPSDEGTSRSDLRVETSIPRNEASLGYPEKDDVVRLLVRASELESDGRFQDALVATDEAVAIDPGSPQANEMKARLEELLRRIQASPRLGERTESS